jgi:hypothetical protein
MKPPLTILVTGSRYIKDMQAAESQARFLLAQEAALRGPENITVIHGAAEGWDTLFDSIVANWMGMQVLDYPAKWFDNPLKRNQFMVDLVSNHFRDFRKFEVVCWAFANRWASGTGHCARRARLAGIPVIDYGESTEWKGRNHEPVYPGE